MHTQITTRAHPCERENLLAHFSRYKKPLLMTFAATHRRNVRESLQPSTANEKKNTALAKTGNKQLAQFEWHMQSLRATMQFCDENFPLLHCFVMPTHASCGSSWRIVFTGFNYLRHLFMLQCADVTRNVPWILFFCLGYLHFYVFVLFMRANERGKPQSFIVRGSYLSQNQTHLLSETFLLSGNLNKN